MAAICDWVARERAESNSDTGERFLGVFYFIIVPAGPMDPWVFSRFLVYATVLLCTWNVFLAETICATQSRHAGTVHKVFVVGEDLDWTLDEVVAVRYDALLIWSSEADAEPLMVLRTCGLAS
jgi:hypothetical protein